MQKSNKSGGKNHKKYKKTKIDTDTQTLSLAEPTQVYAQVIKKQGGTRLSLLCSDGKNRSGIIPGKFYKQVFMNSGDVLLCDLNIEGDDGVCYIVHKYNAKDVMSLTAMKLINFQIDEKNSIQFANNDNKNNDKLNYLDDISMSTSDD